MKTIIGSDIEIAAKIIREGGIVAIPTETVYGLACHALREDAIQKLYNLKGRDFIKPFSIQLDSFGRVGKYARYVPKVYLKIAAKYCPGPLTLIFRKNSKIPAITTSGMDTVGVRIPDHPVTLDLLKILGFPLAVSSANISGYPEPLNSLQVLRYMDEKIPYILDGGECTIGKASTVIGIKNRKLFIFREGAVSGEEIMKIANR